MSELLDLIRRHTVYDLAQPYFAGMPHFPTHPPYLFGLTRKHGDMLLEGDVSSSADSIAFGGHVGTHIDALCHFSCDGKLHGGMEAAAVQSDYGGIQRTGCRHHRAHSAPRRAVGHRRGNEAERMTRCRLILRLRRIIWTAALKTAKTTIEPGDVVLLRTGWARFFPDAARYLTGGRCPRRSTR